MSRNQGKDKERILEQLRKTPIVEVACHNIGLPRATYYRWRKEDETFADACDEAIDQSAGKITDMAESRLISAIKEKNMSAIIFWLRHHHPAYESRLRVDGRIRHESELLSPEQEQLVAKALHMVGLLPETGKDHDG